jgi:hypothetical protein
MGWSHALRAHLEQIYMQTALSHLPSSLRAGQPCSYNRHITHLFASTINASVA